MLWTHVVSDEYPITYILFEENPYACACAVVYIVLPGENREDSSIWRNSLCFAHALNFSSSYLEKTEKTPPFEEIPYALRMRCVLHRLTWRKPRRLLHLKKFLMLCACAVAYIVLPGENREDSSIWRNSLCFAHALCFTSSYLEKTEKTPPFEEFLSVKMSRIKKFYLCQKGSFVLFCRQSWKS